MDKIMANIPKATDPKDLTLEMAIELIDKKIAKGGGKATKPKARTKKGVKK
jgi:DNA topoisomerase-1